VKNTRNKVRNTKVRPEEAICKAASSIHVLTLPVLIAFLSVDTTCAHIQNGQDARAHHRTKGRMCSSHMLLLAHDVASRAKGFGCEIARGALCALERRGSGKGAA